VTTVWAETAYLSGAPVAGVRFGVDAAGRITHVETGVSAHDDDLRLGTVLPGIGNAHSHAFHRLLRGTTHGHGGDFWRWRESMYDAAASLDPQRYLAVARAVFAEMLVSGYTAVGEFHYLHHTADGTPYDPAHAMELALATAASDVGIRLVLLDTVYLAGGFDLPLSEQQRAFDDRTPERYLERWHALRAVLPAEHTLGAAIHSVRAVPADAIRAVLAGLPQDIPLHVHVSEQPQENADTLAATGLTPTALLHSLGALTPRLSLVHATHLSDDDIALIGAAGASVVLCPTTEADLGDGIGPARALADAGARLAIGSDQNAVIDPLLELRGLEAGERLSSGQRGRFSPSELVRLAASGGYTSLGLGGNDLAVGDLCDLVEVSTSSVRTTGTASGQLALTATATDVGRVLVGGRVVADRGRLVGATSGLHSRRPERLLAAAIATLTEGTS